MKIGYNRRGRKNTHNPNNNPSWETSRPAALQLLAHHTHALSLVSLY